MSNLNFHLLSLRDLSNPKCISIVIRKDNIFSLWLLATWRYERNPHATCILQSDKITEFKDLNLHKSRRKLEMIIAKQCADLLQNISVQQCCNTPLFLYFIPFFENKNCGTNRSTIVRIFFEVNPLLTCNNNKFKL